MEDTLSTITSIRSSVLHNSTVLELLLVVLTCTLLTWYLQFLWSRRKLYMYSRKLEGPLALPLIGSALSFIGHPDDITPKLLKTFKQYPGIFRIWFGTKLFYCVSDPKYYEILLPRCLGKNDWYRFFEPAIGHGLFTAPLDTWKRHRKILMPTFSQKILDGFMNIFDERSQVMVEQLRKFEGKGEFNIFEIVARCALDIVCETAMGVKVNTQIGEGSSLPEHIYGIMENTFMRMMNAWYHFDIIFSLTSRAKVEKAAVEALHDFSGQVVKQKKELFDEARKRRESTGEMFFEEECYKRKGFLDHLLEMTTDSNQITERELRDEVDTFIVAGSDTTSTATSYIFIMLGLHQDLQEKVYQEILEVVGPDRPVEKEDLAKLRYMERFIKETLRLFPVAAAISRAVDEDVDLGDHVVPAGVSVFFSFVTTHTNEKYFPDPYRFDPDRFLPEEVKKRHPLTYLPFSYGSRNCIGLKYAMMVMKSLAVAVVRKFKFSTSFKSIQDIKFKPNLILRPTEGFKVSLESR